MKRQITFAILLFSSLGAFAQVTQEDLEKEIKPLTQKVNSLQSENSKLKSEIGTLNSKLSNANKSIDSLRTKTQENSNPLFLKLQINLAFKSRKQATKTNKKSPKFRIIKQKFSLWNYWSAFSNLAFRSFVLVIEQKTTNRQN
jgi:septal ring factor EnvC (AmiA/AmiB activator)